MNRAIIIFTGSNKVLPAILLILPTLLLYSLTGAGQKVVDDEMKSLFRQGNPPTANFSKPLREADNEIKFITGAAFLFYKTFISSQDRPSCVFTPSCSEYAVEALNQKGLIAGWLYTFDRLSRCHGFVNRSHYVFSSANNRFYDPLP